jgi:hypothetical protein
MCDLPSKNRCCHTMSWSSSFVSIFSAESLSPPVPQSAAARTKEAKEIRANILERIVHGWPQEWVNASPKFEEVGVIETGKGYRIRKFRYEVVPGYYAGAVLYEPEKQTGRVPGILNVLGHERVFGKSAEYMQKICINLAKQQIMALSLEFIDTGEANKPGNDHSFGAQLNLVGLQGDGLFYLAMRKGPCVQQKCRCKSTRCYGPFRRRLADSDVKRT